MRLGNHPYTPWVPGVALAAVRICARGRAGWVPRSVAGAGCRTRTGRPQCRAVRLPASTAATRPARNSERDLRLSVTLGALARLVRLHVGSFAPAEIDSPLRDRRQVAQRHAVDAPEVISHGFIDEHIQYPVWGGFGAYHVNAR